MSHLGLIWALTWIIPLGVIIFLILLVVRAVRAAERMANALEESARRPRA